MDYIIKDIQTKFKIFSNQTILSYLKFLLIYKVIPKPIDFSYQFLTFSLCSGYFCAWFGFG